MNMQCIVFGLIFLVTGIAFFIGVGSNWIKEWREMTAEEKGKLRMAELGRNVGCVFFAAGAIFLTSGFSPEFMRTAFMWCMIAWFILTGLDVAFITRSSRYETRPMRYKAE